MKLFNRSLCLSLLVLSTATLADVAIVVNSANNNAVDDDSISRIFLGKVKSYGNGDSIEPVNSAGSNAARAEFEEKVLNKSSSQVKAYWSKLIFSGKGKPPKELDSDMDVIKYVAANPSAIGYVDAGAVDSSVKVLKTF